MGDILLFILIMVAVVAAFVGMLRYDPNDFDNVGWVDGDGKTYYAIRKCSKCGEEEPDGSNKYCPNCGCRMRNGYDGHSHNSGGEYPEHAGGNRRAKWKYVPCHKKNGEQDA